MNEILKTLWNQAMKKTNEEVSTSLGKDYFFVHEQVLRKNFAELIVKKCADAADMAYDARCAYPGDYVGESLGCGTEEGVAVWRSKE